MSIIRHKTKNGMAEFEFLVESSEDGTYRPYLIRLWRKTDVTAKRYKTTALIQDGLNRYITMSPPPHSVKEAERVAIQWAEETEQNFGLPELLQQAIDAQVIQAPSKSTGGVLRMTTRVWRQIEESVGSRPAETGGPLGGSRDTFLVERFHFDRSARQTGATYSPDHEELNRIFREEWNLGGINLLGFVHSHPTHFWRPSGGDLAYARDILRAIPDLPYLLLPIVKTRADTGKFEIFPYAAVRNGNDLRIVALKLEITDKIMQGNGTTVRVHSPSPETREGTGIASNGTDGLSKSPGHACEGNSGIHPGRTGVSVDVADTSTAASHAHRQEESNGKEDNAKVR